jgi:hypothetical protein
VQEDGDATSACKGKAPVAVPVRARPAGEARDRWLWAEPWMWMARLLTALEERVTDGEVPSVSAPAPCFCANTGSSPCAAPMPWSVSPLEGNTIDWRAGCGRSASPVRREGGSNSIDPPYPYWWNQRRLIGN